MVSGTGDNPLPLPSLSSTPLYPSKTPACAHSKRLRVCQHQQQHQPTNQPTSTHTTKHSNTQQHHISFMSFLLLFLVPFLSFPFLLCSVRSVFSLLVFVIYLVSFVFSIVSNDVSLFLLCLCFFSLCFHGFPMKMKNVTCVPPFPSLLSLLSYLLSPSTLSCTLQN